MIAPWDGGPRKEDLRRMGNQIVIVYVGDLDPSSSRSYQRKRAFEELGHTVIAHPSVPPEQTYYDKPSIPSRVLWKLGLPPDPTRANKSIQSDVERYQPDVLWIDKGVTIWPWTLRAVKKLSPNTRLVSFAEDDMFARHNRTLFYTQGLKYYDFVFTTKSYNCHAEELPSLGAKRVVFVDNGYDSHLHRPVALTPQDVERLGGDVGFIGSYERARAESLLYLAANGVQVRVWGGGGWHKLLGQHPNLIIENRPLYGDDYTKGLCATKICLAFLCKANRDVQTTRTAEIPACGAFMLAERTDEHLRLFEEGKEAAYFSSNEELLEKVRYYLDHETEREEISAAARERCLKGGYSHQERLEFMLSVVANGSA